MPTNLAIDDELLRQALALGKHKTKRETINEALAEYIRRRQQREIVDLFGTVDWDPAYDQSGRAVERSG